MCQVYESTDLLVSYLCAGKNPVISINLNDLEAQANALSSPVDMVLDSEAFISTTPQALVINPGGGASIAMAMVSMVLVGAVAALGFN